LNSGGCPPREFSIAGKKGSRGDVWKAKMPREGKIKKYLEEID